MPTLIGRERELSALTRAIDSASRSAGACVLLTGEAGIGKSRLVSELRARASAQRFTILEGHCFEQDRSFPYAPWIDALRAFLAPRSASETSQMLGALASELVKLLPELSLLDPAIQPNPPLDPQSEKHRLFEALVRLAAALARASPLLLVLEDLHWSDEPSLELLEVFSRRIAALPILVLGTYRSEDISPRLPAHFEQLGRERFVEDIRLAPLSRDEIGQMVRASLHTDRAGARLLDELARLTEGNPYFIEEILKSLPEDGEWDQLHIPRSIQASVQRRVALLPESTQHTVSLAAVIGQRFDFGLLQAIAAQAEQPLLAALKELSAAQLIVEQSADQFAFRHALTREAVYAGLMQRERRALHQAIAEAIERLAEGRSEAAAAQLAYHYGRAGVWPKAADYARRAGEQAQALYALREALDHFTQALQAAQHETPANAPGRRGQAARLLRGRAKARDMLGDFDGARADYQAALELAQGGEDRTGEWQALIDLGFLWQSRDLERADEYYQRALALARRLGDASLLAQTLNRVGNWHTNCGRVHEALAPHHEALALFRELNDRHGLAATLDLLAIVSNQLGEFVQGMAYLEQAIPILRAVDDRQALVNTLTNLAALAHFETEVFGELNYRRFVDLSEEALGIARGFQWHQGEVRALIPGALSLAQAGDYTRALEWVERAKAIMEAIRHRESLVRLQISFGQILMGLLAFAEARRELEAGLALAQELGSGLFTLAGTAQLASALVLQHDLAQAKVLLDARLPAEYPAGRASVPLRRLWSTRAELELAEGHPGEALTIVERLLDATLNRAQSGPYSVPYLSRLRAQALAALGRTKEAEAELLGTLVVARALGQRPMLWRLHADLGQVYRRLRRRAEAEREFAAARAIIQDLTDNIPEGGLRENFFRQASASLPAAAGLTPRQAAKREFAGLTGREREVAALIAQGKSNREIADELVISAATAERHVANILSKLGLSSRTQIAVWAVEKGLGQ